MRKFTSFLCTSAVLLLFVLAPNKARASHGAGAEIIYEWISDSTYRFFFKFYRDCTGIQEEDTKDLCCFEKCTNTSFTVSMTKWSGPLPGGGVNGSPVSAGCTLYPDKCTDPSSILPGYKEWWYSCIVTLPLKCNNWKFAAWVGARNPSNNITGGNIYVETTFDNATIAGIDSNSSPYFSIKPIPYMCLNQPYSFNNGAIDPNGDSVVTTIIQPLNHGDCTTTPAVSAWQSGSPAFNLTNNPFQTNNSFVLIPQTGQMSFTPTQGGPSTLTTKVTEYRYGKEIGYILRDIQVQVMACSTQQPVIAPLSNTIIGGSYLNNRVNGCINQPLNFCFEVKSPDTETILVVEDNHKSSIPNAIITYTNQRTDSVRGCFSWTPGVTDTGLKNFIVATKDSTCRPPGIMLYYSQIIPVYIWPPTRGLGDTSICPRGPAYLSAKGGGNYQWTQLPGGTPNSLSCTGCTSPVARPVDTTFYVVTSTINTFCPNSNKDTVRVAVLPAATFGGQNDTTTCPHNAVHLDIHPNPPAGVTYRFKWKPSTWLNNDTISNPISNPNSDQQYIVEVTSSNSICKSYDTIYVDVLDGFKILTPDTAICEGGTVPINAVGDPRYTYSWSTPSPAGGINDPNILIPSITPGVLGKYKYTVKASYLTCTDSFASINIETQPIPSVTVDEDAKICYGDTMKLHGVIKPDTYPYKLTWTPGASLDDPNIAEPVFTANNPGDNILTLVASSSAGCSDSDKVTLTVFPAKFLFVSNDTAMCPGDSVQLSLTTNGIKSYYWYPDANISNTKGLQPIVWPASTQYYYVYGVDTNLCLDTQKVRITVKPAAMVELPDSIKLYPGESYEMNPSGNCLYFSWFPNTGLSQSNISNPIAAPGVNTKYILTGTTEYGCSAKDEITVLVMPDSYLDVPNAFTAGGNNTLKPIHLGAATLKSFSIYNRWGVKVFESNDINKGWDGKFGGELQPMGVYIYMIQATTATGRTFTKQGNVTLVR